MDSETSTTHYSDCDSVAVLVFRGFWGFWMDCGSWCVGSWTQHGRWFGRRCLGCVGWVSFQQFEFSVLVHLRWVLLAIVIYIFSIVSTRLIGHAHRGMVSWSRSVTLRCCFCKLRYCYSFSKDSSHMSHVTSCTKRFSKTTSCWIMAWSYHMYSFGMSLEVFAGDPTIQQYFGSVSRRQKTPWKTKCITMRSYFYPVQCLMWQEYAYAFPSDHNRGLGRDRQRGGSCVFQPRFIICETPKSDCFQVMKLQPWTAGFFILYLHAWVSDGPKKPWILPGWVRVSVY